MLRDAPPAEQPRSPLILRMVEAGLGDDPVDAALIQMLRDPAAMEARARADADLRANDWPNLGRYQTANAEIIASGVHPDVVFMGDSITEIWSLADPSFFSTGRVNRGISGQTSPQMLVRFQADVIALKPKAVHLFCGVNDIAGNTGSTTPYRYQCNIRAMSDLATANGVRVILGAISPATGFTWNPSVNPRPWVAELNAWLRELVAERGFALIDYHTPMAEPDGAMRASFTKDGVHPNRGGYAVMRAAAEPVLASLGV